MITKLNTQSLTLGDICKFSKGFGGFKASTYKEAGIPILRVANIDNFEINEKNLVYIDSNDYSQDLNKYLLKKNDLIIAKDASIGKLGKINIDREFLFNSHILKIEPISDKVNRDYLYHFLISKSKEIENLKLGVILPALDIDRLKKIKISLPDLATQAKIANKLNQFWKLSGELCGELCGELNLRKKQYEYYRDELLSFKQDNKIEWLTLGEIATDI
ncbi:restriction endonuclease subunit S, partial [Candidatus Mycoplasma haematobovis]|uniref:restriction endonuclease subunit S n=1 Tax=Candidatus Mycoplasma haematobovis TaxID=432608 RepID=UPI000A61FF1B